MTKGYFKVLVNPDMDFDIFYVPLKKNIPQEQMDFCIMVEETEDILKAMWMQKKQRNKRSEDRRNARIFKETAATKNIEAEKPKSASEGNTGGVPKEGAQAMPEEEAESIPEGETEGVTDESTAGLLRSRYEDILKYRPDISFEDFTGILKEGKSPFIAPERPFVLNGIPHEIEINQVLPSKKFSSKLATMYNKDDFFSSLK